MALRVHCKAHGSSANLEIVLSRNKPIVKPQMSESDRVDVPGYNALFMSNTQSKNTIKRDSASECATDVC